MNKLVAGLIAIVIVIGLIVGLLFFSGRSTPPTVATTTTSSAPVSVTVPTTTTTTTSGPRILAGSVLYEIVAPTIIGGQNYTTVWLIMNITNTGNYTAYISTFSLNGQITEDPAMTSYPLNAPKYSPLYSELVSAEALPPKKSMVGWIAFQISGLSAPELKYVTLDFYYGSGEILPAYSENLYLAPNYTIIHADQLVFLNNTVSLNLPAEAYYFIVPGENVTLPLAIASPSLYTTYTNVTVLGFSSPLIKAYGLPVTVPVNQYGMAYANVTVELVKYVPYPIVTYVYVKWEK